jgi:hypothetical protein
MPLHRVSYPRQQKTISRAAFHAARLCVRPRHGFAGGYGTSICASSRLSMPIKPPVSAPITLPGARQFVYHYRASLSVIVRDRS